MCDSKEQKTNVDGASVQSIVQARIRFKWKACPNPDINVVSVDALVPRVSKHFSCCKAEVDNDEGRRLSDAIESQAGVTEFWSDKYSLTVEKGDVFSWDEVRPRIISVLSEFFGQPLIEA